MAVLRGTLKNFLTVTIDEGGLSRLSWRDLGDGLSMARLAREGARELVLYRIAAGAAPDVFRAHEHIGG
ncbi:MAG TPA: hypothetical protein VNO43_00950, partial [Candidatus Eisenbacteria bacterium]|nr:hypothetical protein [Candidatus Eisenbacteria bacterium]